MPQQMTKHPEDKGMKLSRFTFMLGKARMKFDLEEELA